MPDEDNNLGGSLVLDFREWWRHVQPKNKNYVIAQRWKLISNVELARNFVVRFQILNCNSIVNSIITSLRIAMRRKRMNIANLKSANRKHFAKTIAKTRFALSKAQFRRRTFNEPNLIRIWTDPN